MIKNTFFIGIFLMSLFSPGFAEEKITIVTEEWAPFNYQENGKIVGFSTELLQEMLSHLKIKAPIKIYPWARAYRLALNNKNTLLYTVAKTDERQYLFKWIGPIAPRKMYFFKLKNRNDIVVHSLTDAKSYIVGSVRDDAFSEFLYSNGFQQGINVILEPDAKTNIHKLFSKHIDIFAGPELGAAFLAKKQGLNFDKMEKLITVIDKGNYYFAFNKDTDDQLIEQFQSVLDEIKHSGVFGKIKSKYL